MPSPRIGVTRLHVTLLLASGCGPEALLPALSQLLDGFSKVPRATQAPNGRAVPPSRRGQATARRQGLPLRAAAAPGGGIREPGDLSSRLFGLDKVRFRPHLLREPRG